MVHVLWMTAVAHAQTIQVSGLCPGTLEVTVGGATPNGPVMVVAGVPNQSDTLPTDPCIGIFVDVGNPVIRGKGTADASGTLTLTPTVPSFSCGRGLQAVDVATCNTSAANRIPQCADTDLDGVTGCGGDCDDTDPAVNPFALEVCEDGVDNDCSGTDRSCSPVGEFMVGDGPVWGTDPRVVSCVETCAYLFGGSRDRYHCSVDPLVLDFTSFVSGWGDGTFCTTPVPEDFSKEDPTDPGYNCGAFGCAYSAYVADWCFSGETNYCWEH
jgi:hypothetical protein